MSNGTGKLMPLRIAYVINEYPKVTHSFIRREILALEKQGFEILRIAMRGWDAELVDEEDRRERKITHYLLQEGFRGLLSGVLRALLTSPWRLLSALALAMKMGWRAERPLFYHLAYLAEACRMLPWLKSFGASHMHAHFGTNSAEVALLAHVLGGPQYSFTVHGPGEFDLPQFNGIIEKVRRAAFVIAISSFARSQIFRWVPPTYWPKVKVVHCGLDLAFHSIEPAPPVPTPRLVCVGRLSRSKGQLLLVAAANRLAQKGVKFELVLAGDGEMRDQIEQLIMQHGLHNHVRITGWLTSKQVRDEILAARGLVLSSFGEGLPVVIMEAMALRRPVLATYLAGIPELVQPGVCGWLVPAGSVDELAAALEDFLTTPKDKLQEMGEAAYRRVMERHSIDIEAAKLAVHFREANSGVMRNGTTRETKS